MKKSLEKVPYVYEDRDVAVKFIFNKDKSRLTVNYPTGIADVFGERDIINFFEAVSYSYRQFKKETKFKP